MSAKTFAVITDAERIARGQPCLVRIEDLPEWKRKHGVVTIGGNGHIRELHLTPELFVDYETPKDTQP